MLRNLAVAPLCCRFCSLQLKSNTTPNIKKYNIRCSRNNNSTQDCWYFKHVLCLASLQKGLNMIMNSKKTFMLRIVCLMFSILNGIYQIKWRYLFETELCELFQSPFPNYGDLLQINNIMIICFCVIALIMSFNNKLFIHNRCLLILILFQLIHIFFEIIYGELNDYFVIYSLQPIPLLVSLLIYYRSEISELLIVCFLVFDFLSYVIIEYIFFGINIFRDFFDFFNPFNDLFSRALFTILFLFVILLNGEINKSDR